MSNETTELTRHTARGYFAAWTTSDTSATAALLADGFRFEGPGMRIDGKDAFLDANAFPSDATVVMVAAAAEGEMAFQMYDATRSGKTVRIVEHLTISGGKIASSTFVTDMGAFHAFMAAGA